MKLPGLFSSPAAALPQHFFVIYFAEHQVVVGLWEVANGQVKLLRAAEAVPWKEDAGLVDAVDHALQQLGTESDQVKQTLFALEPTWVNQQGIHADKKTLFQKLTKELSLEAVGFVVIPEAIIQYQLNRQGNALQCLVIDVLAERVSLSMVKHGKLGQQEMVGRSPNLVDDVKEGFARFQDGGLPAMVFLYSAYLTIDELEEARQRLLELDLVNDYHFLQQPTFEVIPADEILEVILQTGGRAVAEAKQLLAASLPDMPPAAAAAQSDPSPAALSPTKASPSAQTVGSESWTELPNDQPADLPNFSPAAAVPRWRPIVFGVIGVVIGLLVLSGGILAFGPRLISAVVEVELKTQPVNKTVQLRLDPQAVVSDPTSGVLKAEVIKQTVSGEKTAETTGKKIIGDKAKGSVMLYNRTSSPKTFEAGTVLTAGKFKFTLDKTETVASASTGSNFETKPGTLETAITAVEIGTESNLPKNTEMTVANFSIDTYVAKTTTELSGGTSREIKAVSAKDQEELAAALRKELSAKAVEQLTQQQGEGKRVFPTNRLKVTGSKFSAEVGKETNSFSLTMTVEAEAIALSIAELRGLANQLIQTELPTGYTVAPEEVQILTEVTATATTAAQVAIKTDLSASGRPSPNTEAWRQEILKLSEREAVTLLRSKPEVAAVKITRTPGVLTGVIPQLPSDPARVQFRVR